MKMIIEKRKEHEKKKNVKKNMVPLRGFYEKDAYKMEDLFIQYVVLDKFICNNWHNHYNKHNRNHNHNPRPLQ